MSGLRVVQWVAVLAVFALGTVASGGPGDDDGTVEWPIYLGVQPGPGPNILIDPSEVEVGYAELEITTTGKLRIDVMLEDGEADTTYEVFVVSPRHWGPPSENFVVLRTDDVGEGKVKLQLNVPTYFVGYESAPVKLNLREQGDADPSVYTTGVDALSVPAAWVPNKLYFYEGRNVSPNGLNFQPVDSTPSFGFVTWKLEEGGTIDVEVHLKGVEAKTKFEIAVRPRFSIPQWPTPDEGVYDVILTNPAGNGSGGLEGTPKSLPSDATTINVKINARAFDDTGPLGYDYTTGNVFLPLP